MGKKLPKSIQKLCWYGLLDRERNKKLIITLVFNIGGIREIKWVLSHYEKEDLRDAISNPLRGEWEKKSLRFWAAYFSVTYDRETEKKALRSLFL